MNEKTKRINWFKVCVVLLLSVLVVYVILCGSLLLYVQKANVRQFKTEQTIITTEFEDVLFVRKMEHTGFPDGSYYMEVEWNNQRKVYFSEDGLPHGADLIDWYLPREQKDHGENLRVYEFSWGTVTIRNEELIWSAANW